MAATQDAQELFNSHDSAVAPLGLVVTEGARELGEKINAHLVSWATPDNNPRGTFLVENECPRFSSGDSKGLIRSTIRGDDLFFLVDVGNYSCTYKLFGKQNAMSPDDHFQDLKRLIQAASGKAHRISVIMPLLYGGRSTAAATGNPWTALVRYRNCRLWEFLILLPLTPMTPGYKTPYL